MENCENFQVSLYSETQITICTAALHETEKKSGLIAGGEEELQWREREYAKLPEHEWVDHV